MSKYNINAISGALDSSHHVLFALMDLYGESSFYQFDHLVLRKKHLADINQICYLTLNCGFFIVS